MMQQKRRVVGFGGLVLVLLLGGWGLGCGGPELNTVTVGGAARGYLLHVPPNLDQTRQYPLVLALHQFTDTPEGTEKLSGFSALADQEGFLVAYPKGIMRGWNAGMRDGPDDVAFCEALVDDVAAKFPVDRDRVYACGLSAGGMMSQYLLCRSDRFAAAAAIAGSLTQGAAETCSTSGARPVLLIHGTEDPVVPFGGGETYAGPGMKPVFLSNEAGAAFWAARNGCAGTPVREELPATVADDPTRVIRYTFDCPAGAEVLRYDVVGGGHTWPGGKNWYPAFIVGATSRQLDATAVIWAFFAAHRREAGLR